MLRFVHILEIFQPFYLLIEWSMQNVIAKKRQDVFQLVILFTSAILMAHIMACCWIYLGSLGEELPGGSEDQGWLRKFQYESALDAHLSMPERDYAERWDENTPFQIYWFSLYWIFTVLTTVGYGDYAGTNSRERLFTIAIEFFGLMFFSLLSGLITGLVTPLQDFDAMMTTKTEELNVWIKKLQQANSTVRKTYIPARLYLNIVENVEFAFQ